jgi:hypothetical protein
MFDFANPDLHVPQRSETTVPQQSLFLMNHPTVLERSRSMAKSVAGRGLSPSQQVEVLYQRAFQRPPTASELGLALELITSPAPVVETAPETLVDWSYGYGVVDEQSRLVTSFTELPHFNGSSWQGGASVPDSTLGWVFLNATGGHPGNDRQHAAIRRWTAPRAMNVRLSSKFRHDPASGDGVRAFVVGSRDGILLQERIHQKTAELNLQSINVKAGDTIDFVVDIGDVLNNDQYNWICTIEERLETPDGEHTAIQWNSENDFTRDGNRLLTPLEQLAQVLMCSNEMFFVD